MSIKKLARTQGTFKRYAEKINEIIDEQKPLKAGEGIDIRFAGENILISATSSGGGDSLPGGYTFEEFTICDSGTPATRWWPTWTSNPEA
jgi:hypothetical protein